MFELDALRRAMGDGVAILPAGATLELEEAAETDLSEDGLYRYFLKKPLPHRPGRARKVVGWCILNPSDGTATAKDPTLGRVYEFSSREGGTLTIVVNMFAHRSPEPTDLLHVADPVGPRNDAAIERMAAESDLVIVGWGGKFRYDRRPPPIGGRDRAVLDLLLRHQREVYCLGRNLGSRQPNHPLYLRGDTKLDVYATRDGVVVAS